MAEQRERPLHELLSRNMVDIYVGQDNTHWILHEKLLCYRSKFFRNIFNNKKGTKNNMYGLPDEDDEPFKMFVGWLYSEALPTPKEEKELQPLLDLYLMAEKWEIKKLIIDVLDMVRRWYHDTNTWPSLRRVQYIYANTEAESSMRKLLVSCVARMLVTSESMPAHWEKALRKNGELGVDIIMCVQKWHVDPESVPDTRDESVEPIVEEVEEKKEMVKQGEQEENGVNGDVEEATNGVEEQHEEQQEEAES